MVHSEHKFKSNSVLMLTQGLLTTLVVMYYFTLYYIVKPTHLSSRG